MVIHYIDPDAPTTGTYVKARCGVRLTLADEKRMLRQPVTCPRCREFKARDQAGWESLQESSR